MSNFETSFAHRAVVALKADSYFKSNGVLIVFAFQLFSRFLSIEPINYIFCSFRFSAFPKQVVFNPPAYFLRSFRMA